MESSSIQIHDKITKINKSLEIIRWKLRNDPECNNTALVKKTEKLEKEREFLVKELGLHVKKPAANHDSCF